MKAKQILGLSILIMVVFGFCNSLRVAATASPDGDGPIIIIINPDDPIGEPRGPVFNPFTAYLQGYNVVLNCSVYYGDVVVVLVSTAGDYYTTVFDTSDGSTVIPISNLSGDYTLCLTDASGMQFIGEFNVQNRQAKENKR